MQNGSPSHAVVLGTSVGHSDEFGMFIEDAGFPIKNTLGSQNREVRSDMICFEAVGGGNVFSVGASIGSAVWPGIHTRMMWQSLRQMSCVAF